jgi:calcineurin-like phosphoesterase family protein
VILVYFFTADEHYGHTNIIKYCDRPFRSVEEMDYTMASKHNDRVGPGDIVVHAGDFTLIHDRERVFREYVSNLNGNHIFLKGSHDYWLDKKATQIWKKTIEGQYVVVCHYAMRTWHRSHFNSWQLYGHSHGKLEPIGKQWDVGVDNNNFYPVSFEELKSIMEMRPDNPNLVVGRTDG